MSLFIRLTLTAAAVFSLASCGGGDASAPPQPSSGWVVDGYLSGATVLCDVNGNGVADEGDIAVRTDAGGRFSFAAPGCAGAMGAVGGTDVDTGLPFRGVMKAPAGATVITPLTTLLVGGMSQERLIATLELPAGIDVPHADPGLDPALMRKSRVVAQLLIKTTEMFAGLGGVETDAALQAIHNEVAVSFAILLQGGGALVTGTEVDQALVAQLVKAATQRVAQSPAVAAAVRSALAAVNADSMGIVTAGGLTVQAEHILKAADAELKAKVKASLGDPTITDFVVANAAQLAAAPNAATLTLGATLTELVSQSLGESPVAPVVPATLPIDFDGTTPVPFVGFNGAEGSTIEAGPAGGTGKSLRILRSGGEVYAGAFITTEPLPFAAGRKTLTARVYSPKAGIRMVLKVEGADGLASAEYDATPAVVMGWQTLTWVTTGVDLTKSYTKITMLPNLGTVDAAPGQSYYFDDITLVDDSVAPPPPGYLALLADSISLVNGAVTNVYTMNQFESAAGISVGWPVPSPTLMKVALTEVGTYTLPADLKVSAAVSITETVSGGKGEIQAYIDNVGVRKTATGLEVAIPATSANALVYSVSTDGKKKLVIDFGSSVAGIKQELTTAANMTNSLVFGEVMQYAINQISNDFSGIYQLRGKYKVTVVLSGMPLRRADGRELPSLTVVVPTELNNTGGVALSKTITGPGLTGYITLTD